MVMNEGHPESKDHLRIVLAQVIHHTVQICSQVIFICSQHEGIFGGKTFQKQ